MLFTSKYSIVYKAQSRILEQHHCRVDLLCTLSVQCPQWWSHWVPWWTTAYWGVCQQEASRPPHCCPSHSVSELWKILQSYAEFQTHSSIVVTNIRRRFKWRSIVTWTFWIKRTALTESCGIQCMSKYFNEEYHTWSTIHQRNLINSCIASIEWCKSIRTIILESSHSSTHLLVANAVSSNADTQPGSGENRPRYKLPLRDCCSSPCGRLASGYVMLT